jgi:hypothetical protein
MIHSSTFDLPEQGLVKAFVSELFFKAGHALAVHGIAMNSTRNTQENRSS